MVKNKVSPPFKQAEFDVLFNEGISRIGEIIDLGVEKGIIEKSGAWYSFRGERIGQGRDNVKEFFKNNSGLAAEAEKGIREKYSLVKPGEPKKSESDQKKPVTVKVITNHDAKVGR